jgi:hypothetical protein
MTDPEIITLREHFAALMEQYAKSHAREHELLAESVDHTRENLELRLEAMNQFRAQILSERGTMVTRELYDTQHEVLSKRVGSLERMNSKLIGIGAALVFVMTILEVVLRVIVR